MRLVALALCVRGELYSLPAVAAPPARLVAGSTLARGPLLLCLGEHRSLIDRGEGGRQATLEGSFSSVSTPKFASKYSFVSIFRDLSDPYSFAPLHIQNF